MWFVPVRGRPKTDIGGSGRQTTSSLLTLRRGIRPQLFNVYFGQAFQIYFLLVRVNLISLRLIPTCWNRAAELDLDFMHEFPSYRFLYNSIKRSLLWHCSQGPNKEPVIFASLCLELRKLSPLSLRVVASWQNKQNWGWKMVQKRNFGTENFRGKWPKT